MPRMFENLTLKQIERAEARIRTRPTGSVLTFTEKATLRALSRERRIRLA